MDLSIQIINSKWKRIFTIKAGTTPDQLQGEVYPDIRKSAGNIKNHFLCYSWGTEDEIKYCGSVARDYTHGSQKSNLEGRIRNYFRNHRQESNGRKNANLNVYQNIIETLKVTDIYLSIFEFTEIRLGEKRFSYSEYSEDPELVQAVEQLLICSYKHIGQSPWNRTPSTRISKQIEITKKGQMMKKTGANEIRSYIINNYINPGRENHLKEVHLRSGNIHKELNLKNKMPSVCQVIDGEIFQKQANVTQISRKGPEKSSTVEWVFRLD
jgi:hypothetical protein